MSKQNEKGVWWHLEKKQVAESEQRNEEMGKGLIFFFLSRTSFRGIPINQAMTQR